MSDRASADERHFAALMSASEVDLDRLRETIWAELQTAADSARHGWHLPMVATGGTQPHNRTVVLRDVDIESRSLAFHTDVRSPKVTQIRVTPHVCFCFYDATHRVQLVADAAASVHTDDEIADAGWERSTAASRRCYLAPAAPGDVIAKPKANLPDAFVGKLPAIEQTLPGRENFAVVAARVQRLDFLYLSHEGNLRAEFVLDDGDFHGRWIAA